MKRFMDWMNGHAATRSDLMSILVGYFVAAYFGWGWGFTALFFWVFAVAFVTRAVENETS